MRFVSGLALLACLAACTTTPATPAEPVLGTITRPEVLTEVVTPLEAYFGTGIERHTLARAEDVIVRDCMRGLGFDWPVQDARQPKMTLQAWDLGFMEPDTAGTSGYHPPGQQADMDVSVGGPSTGPRVLSDVEKAAYTGTPNPALMGKQVPKDGCAAEAQRRLDQGAPQADTFAVIELANTTGEKALADSRVAEVTGKWAQCMRGKGHQYQDPYQARDDSRWSIEDQDGKPASAEEIRTAVADQDCRREVNYLGTRLAVITAYQHQEINARPELFAQLETRHHTRMSNAATIVKERL